MSRHVLFVLSTDGKKEACGMRESIDVRFNKAVTLAISGDKLGKNESLNEFPFLWDNTGTSPELLTANCTLHFLYYFREENHT